MIYFCNILMSETFINSLLSDAFVEKYFNTSYELNKEKLMNHIQQLITTRKVKDIESYYSLLNTKGSKTKEMIYRKLQETWIVNNLGNVLIEYAQRTDDTIDNVVDLDDFFEMCKYLYDSNIQQPLPQEVFIFIKLYYAKPVSKTFNGLDFMELYQRALKMINPSEKYLSKIKNPIKELISKLLETNQRFVETWKQYEKFLEQEIIVDSNLILQYMNRFKSFDENNVKDLKILYDHFDQSMKISTIKNNYNILYMLIKDDVINQSKDSFDIGLMKEIGIEKDIIIEFI